MGLSPWIVVIALVIAVFIISLVCGLASFSKDRNRSNSVILVVIVFAVLSLCIFTWLLSSTLQSFGWNFHKSCANTKDVYLIAIIVFILFSVFWLVVGRTLERRAELARRLREEDY